MTTLNGAEADLVKDHEEMVRFLAIMRVRRDGEALIGLLGHVGVSILAASNKP